MPWKTALTTFVAVFIAELGDKTQLATMGLAARKEQRLAVFVGAAAALILSSAVAVLAGAFVEKAIPARYIKIGAGALFVVLGALFLIEGLRSGT